MDISIIKSPVYLQTILKPILNRKQNLKKVKAAVTQDDRGRAESRGEGVHIKIASTFFVGGEATKKITQEAAGYSSCGFGRRVYLLSRKRTAPTLLLLRMRRT